MNIQDVRCFLLDMDGTFYLGENLILHTASDYAKIEEISAARWKYYIQSQRMI